MKFDAKNSQSNGHEVSYIINRIDSEYDNRYLRTLRSNSAFTMGTTNNQNILGELSIPNHINVRAE